MLPFVEDTAEAVSSAYVEVGGLCRVERLGDGTQRYELLSVTVPGATATLGARGRRFKSCRPGRDHPSQVSMCACRTRAIAWVSADGEADRSQWPLGPEPARL